jgi:Fe2+ transport system protein FeoA
MDAILPLQFLRAGEQGEVVDVHGDDRLVARLAEKGLRLGSRLETLMPGNPCVLRIDETKLSLRADDHVEILVRVAQS